MHSSIHPSVHPSIHPSTWVLGTKLHARHQAHRSETRKTRGISFSPIERMAHVGLTVLYWVPASLPFLKLFFRPGMPFLSQRFYQSSAPVEISLTLYCYFSEKTPEVPWVAVSQPLFLPRCRRGTLLRGQSLAPRPLVFAHCCHAQLPCLPLSSVQ